MASATSKDSIQTNPECSTLPEYYSEVNEVSSTTSEMVIVTNVQKMIKLQTEIVNFYNYFYNSELVSNFAW